MRERGARVDDARRVRIVGAFRPAPPVHGHGTFLLGRRRSGDVRSRRPHAPALRDDGAGYRAGAAEREGQLHRLAGRARATVSICIISRRGLQ